jgi:hypothetical protein
MIWEAHTPQATNLRAAWRWGLDTSNLPSAPGAVELLDNAANFLPLAGDYRKQLLESIGVTFERSDGEPPIASDAQPLRACGPLSRPVQLVKDFCKDGLKSCGVQCFFVCFAQRCPLLRCTAVRYFASHCSAAVCPLFCCRGGQRTWSTRCTACCCMPWRHGPEGRSHALGLDACVSRL